MSIQQRRKKEQLLVRAEESRLKFATKRCFVDRKNKMELARMRKAEEACEDKAVLSDGVMAQKREYVQMRRRMAMEGQVSSHHETPLQTPPRC